MLRNGNDTQSILKRVLINLLLFTISPFILFTVLNLFGLKINLWLALSVILLGNIIVSLPMLALSKISHKINTHTKRWLWLANQQLILLLGKSIVTIIFLQILGFSAPIYAVFTSYAAIFLSSYLIILLFRTYDNIN